MIGSNRQRNLAEMPLGIEVMQGVRQFRECEGVIDDRVGSRDDAHGMESQKQLLVTALEETHPGARQYRNACGLPKLNQVYPPSGVKLRPSERSYKPYIVVLLVRYR